MDMDWTKEEEAFRAEMRAFLDENLTADLRDAGKFATSVYPEHEASMAWQAALHERGWAAPHWLPEHGGQDWSAAQKYIFRAEQIAAGAPSLSPMGLHMVAHVIMTFGTEAQKAFFLPRILSGEVFFCQGYSEPDAGSDLAALQTSAVADGTDFVVNGSKIWTTHATEANWMFALVRTARDGRRQKGITFLLIDMATPGVEVQPLTMVSGEVLQTQVFFTDVRVPQENVIGEVGDGWRVAKYLLEFERGGNPATPSLRFRADEIARAAQEIPSGDDGTLLDDPDFSARLAAARMRIDVFEMTELRVLSAIRSGEGAGAMASLMKIVKTELAQHLTELALEAAGPYGMAFQPHATRPGGPVPGHVPPADGHVCGARWQAHAPLRYMNERAGSIYAGTNEIQRNILARLVFGF